MCALCFPPWVAHRASKKKGLWNEGHLASRRKLTVEVTSDLVAECTEQGEERTVGRRGKWHSRGVEDCEGAQSGRPPGVNSSRLGHSPIRRWHWMQWQRADSAEMRQWDLISEKENLDGIWLLPPSGSGAWKPPCSSDFELSKAFVLKAIWETPARSSLL